MKKITFTSPHRKKHFDFFNGMSHPHFQLTANVDVTYFLSIIKANKLPLNQSIVYLLSHTANTLPEFRWRIRDNEIVEHPTVQPSYTIPVANEDVFSFCTVAYHPDYTTFLKRAEEVQQQMIANPSFEDEVGRDDYLFMSAIPWISFTSMQHAMNYHPHDSVPRISWGKIFEQNDKMLMPLSVQTHHALVDGSHMGKFFTMFDEFLNNFNK
ncbi:chloramphenicol acetyltransferase [Flavobacterium sp. ASW18X]|uniref:chloramphenicol acetyltransferase n=1 Tax=Flavobacterium sp. ASW18X TaxID=2572595 RepID=UPI0010ADE551|nr:chloramphenicol acetyltransferase [Flavobacterium sp. ASW18X]TKD66168.1 chloramphenicol acetyltransferase [Flavobacterium sp. ASW18X]